MKRLYFTILILIVCLLHCSADGKKKYPGGKQYLYRIQLTDKSGTPFSLDKPIEFLSQRSIDRRKRQGLAIDSTDLPISPTYIQQIEERGVKVVRMSKWNNTVLVHGKREKVLNALTQLPFVSSVKKVWTSPDSISTTRPWQDYTKEKIKASDTNRYGSSYDQIKNLEGIALHERGYRGRGMLIAVLDGGFMNAELIAAQHNLNILKAKDFVYPESSDFYSEIDHGTKVLSCMALNIEGIYVGTAPEAQYLLLRSETSETESLSEEDFWTSAAEYADSMGVDVINSSLSYHSFDDKNTDYKYSQLDGKTALISRTAGILSSKGIVLVNSAGNDGMGAWKKIGVPADADDILTVGATTNTGHNAPFSSIGPSADNRVKPDIVAIGAPASVMTGRGTIIEAMGTSFACPIVAGLVACLWQALPNKTAHEIIDIIRRSAENYNTPDNIYGYGKPSFRKALKL